MNRRLDVDCTPPTCLYPADVRVLEKYYHNGIYAPGRCRTCSPRTSPGRAAATECPSPTRAAPVTSRRTPCGAKRMNPQIAVVERQDVCVCRVQGEGGRKRRQLINKNDPVCLRVGSTKTLWIASKDCVKGTSWRCVLNCDLSSTSHPNRKFFQKRGQQHCTRDECIYEISTPN